MTVPPATPPFDPPEVDWRPVEERLIRLRLVTRAIVFGVLIVAAVVPLIIWRRPWIALPLAAVVLLGAWLAWRVPRVVRATAYAVRDRDLYYREGLIVRSLTIVPYVRIQYVDVQVGPLERAFNLATLTVHTASAGLSSTAVPGLAPETAAHLRDVLTDRDKLAPEAP